MGWPFWNHSQRNCEYWITAPTKNTSLHVVNWLNETRCFWCYMEPPTRFELVTFALPWRRSTNWAIAANSKCTFSPPKSLQRWHHGLTMDALLPTELSRQDKQNCKIWWSVWDSNSWPLLCHSSALISWANAPCFYFSTIYGKMKVWKRFLLVLEWIRSWHWAIS